MAAIHKRGGDLDAIKTRIRSEIIKNDVLIHQFHMLRNTSSPEYIALDQKQDALKKMLTSIEGREWPIYQRGLSNGAKN